MEYDPRLDGKNWLLHGLQELYSTKRHCDVDIRVQKSTFPCHRVVLSAASGYFDVMFTSGMLEANSNTVEIKDLSAKTFSNMLEFVYNTETVITHDTVEDLLHGACRLQIPRLKAECELFLMENVSAENCVGVWLTARSLSCEALQRASWSAILDGFDDVITNEEYLKLEAPDFLEIIKNDNLKTKCENEVCRASLKWVKANEVKRRQCLVELFTEIRLSEVELEFLLREVYTNQLVLADMNCMRLLTKAVTYHALPDRRHTSNSIAVRLRNSSNKASLFVVIGRRHSSYGPDITEIVGYNAKDGNWYTLSSMPCDLGDDFATCAYGNDIFVSGGTANPCALLRFSAKQYEWVERARLVQGRYRHSLVAAAHSVYAVGGYNFGTLDSVEEYDISSDTWTTAGKLRHAVDAATTAAHAEKLYVFGGWKGFAEETTAIQCFDMNTNECTVVSHLPSPTKDARVVSINKTMYIVCTSGDILSFKPDLTIQKLDTLYDFNKKNFGLHIGGESVFIVGGESVEHEDDGTDTKLSDGILPLKLKGTEVAQIPKNLPIPLHVHGCFQTVVKLRYPIVEFSEQFSFTH